jgi:hypothetical protein
MLDVTGSRWRYSGGRQQESNRERKRCSNELSLDGVSLPTPKVSLVILSSEPHVSLKE